MTKIDRYLEVRMVGAQKCVDGYKVLRYIGDNSHYVFKHDLSDTLHGPYVTRFAARKGIAQYDAALRNSVDTFKDQNNSVVLNEESLTIIEDMMEPFHIKILAELWCEVFGVENMDAFKEMGKDGQKKLLLLCKKFKKKSL